MLEKRGRSTINVDDASLVEAGAELPLAVAEKTAKEAAEDMHDEEARTSLLILVEVIETAIDLERIAIAWHIIESVSIRSRSAAIEQGIAADYSG
jgi:hypothetical protein